MSGPPDGGGWARLKGLARTRLPPWAARPLRRWAVHLRHRGRRAACRRAYRRHADRYPHPVLFVAGLPKSGTTWMERMLASYPGFREIMIPEAVDYELRHGGSHDFELPDDLFARLDGLLAVLKLHVSGSAHNARLLREAGLPYLVMYRDLRDVAVSHVHYVRRTPWHPEHPAYRETSVREGLERFARTLLPAFVEWLRSWEANRDPDRSLAVRYEDLLADTAGTFREVARLYGLPDDPETVESIVEAHRFERLTGGRSRGEEGDSFFRKGTAGDWRNHFTEELAQLYREVAGRALADFGYEPDPSC